MDNIRLKRYCSVRVMAVLLVGCVAGIIIGSLKTALATPASGFMGTTLVRTLFDEIDLKTRAEMPRHKVDIRTKGMSDVYVVINTVVPGGHSGWHTHPGPSIVSVKSGTAVVYSGDDPSCRPQIYPAGTGFVDPGDGHVHLVRNESEIELEVVAFQIVPASAPRRIDAPSPGNCPF